MDIDKIKRLGIVAMFSDDDLMDQLVLKGGNALDAVLGISSRPSVDLDFSIDGDFADLMLAKSKIEQTIKSTYAAEGYVAFDVTLQAKPDRIAAEHTGFWGGYKVEFKLIEHEKHEECAGDIEKVRRHALPIGKAKTGSHPSTKFEIDLSKHEYCDTKETALVDGFNIFVYSPAMLVCEKIRAICQQIPSYVDMVRSHRRSRARDFFDIYTVTEHCDVAFDDESAKVLVSNVFEAKRVPLPLIGEIETQREFHRDGFQSVRDTVRPGVTIHEFDVYFDHVLDICSGLEPLWNE